ncbi:MAG: SDR family NAD(P)-dependent oxidoreductase [Actinobacteria bacterium]|jgi:NAD(P)-dependent dehydrogenase (short-subunit alcohol dehydrogenase family)|nr:SDR family NAD(P)-dependent oxidoreductase [Actinomycetota bacterium]
MRTLEGKVAVITGGASGIGLALAHRFQRAGMHVAVADIEPGALDAATAALGAGEVLAVRTDVTVPAEVEALRAAVLDRFGAAHVVCANAGVAPTGSILTTSLETWRWVVDVNLMGVVHTVATFGPGLVDQGDGHLVLTASAAGLSATVGLGAYCATKHAVVGTATTLQAELAGTGVGVSVLCPGLVSTRIFDSERNRPDPGVSHADPETASMLKGVIGGGVDPAVIADAVHDAVVADELFILPTTDVIGLIQARLDGVAAALPRV